MLLYLYAHFLLSPLVLIISCIIIDFLFTSLAILFIENQLKNAQVVSTYSLFLHIVYIITASTYPLILCLSPGIQTFLERHQSLRDDYLAKFSHILDNRIIENILPYSWCTCDKIVGFLLLLLSQNMTNIRGQFFTSNFYFL